MLIDTVTSALIHHTLLLLHQNTILMKLLKRLNLQRNDRKVVNVGHTQQNKTIMKVKKI